MRAGRSRNAKALTARFVETAKTSRRLQDFPDALVQGLQLRVTDRGSKSWSLRYTRKSDGKLRRLTIGAYPAFSLEQARLMAREAIMVVARGGDPAGAAQARKQAESFQEVATEWMERHAKANKSDRVRADDWSMLTKHVFPVIGAMKAAEVSKRDVLKLLDAVKATPDGRAKAGNGSRKLTHRPNRVFSLVRSIFRWAVGQDLLAHDPTLAVPPPIKAEKERERVLSPDEILTLWKALERAPRERWASGLATPASEIPFPRSIALTIALALATAQRIGEVAGIAMTELDLNDVAPVWTVPGDRAKNGQANRVPLSSLAVRLIREAMTLAGGSPWLFPAADGAGPISAATPTKALERARPVIGIADFRLHDLRRTAATRMAEMGVRMETVSLVLNHISARKGTVTGKVYVQYGYDREKREALESWSARLERIIGGAEGGNVVAIGRA